MRDVFSDDLTIGDGNDHPYCDLVPASAFPLQALRTVTLRNRSQTEKRVFDEAPFIDAICANLTEDAPLLVFADWLEEHGQSARAEAFRLMKNGASLRPWRRITKLSELEIARFPFWVEHWKRIGLCTAPANRSVAERAAQEAYGSAGLALPESFIWFNSPWAGAEAVARGRQRDPYLWEISDSFWIQVEAQAAARIESLVWPQTRALIRNQIGDRIAAHTAQVREQVREHVAVSGSDYYAVNANCDIARLSCYHFIKCHGVDCGDYLDAMLQLAQSCGLFWWPFENAVILTERPKLLRFDDEGKLHGSPAIEYRNGFRVNAVHGRRFGTLANS